MKILDTKPPTYSSSIVLNLLGFQLFRIFFYSLLRIVGGPKKISSNYNAYLDELINNGVAVIPDFLPETSYQELRSEYNQLEKKFSRTDKNLALPHVDVINFFDDNVSNSFRNFFFASDVVKQIPQVYLGRSINLPIEARLANIYLERIEEMSMPHNGGTNNLHADTPMRSLKIFYYVTDTDEHNAALKYCKGSNRMSLTRLWIEYKLSVRYAFNKWRNHPRGQYPVGRPWVELTDAEIQSLKLQPESLCVKGNTLVFVDVGGFHMRGEFKSLTSRKTIEINYRPIDTLRNYIYPLEKRLLKKV